MSGKSAMCMTVKDGDSVLIDEDIEIIFKFTHRKKRVVVVAPRDKKILRTRWKKEDEEHKNL